MENYIDKLNEKRELLADLLLVSDQHLASAICVITDKFIKKLNDIRREHEIVKSCVLKGMSKHDTAKAVQGNKTNTANTDFLDKYEYNFKENTKSKRERRNEKIHAFYLAGRSIQEISSELNCSESTVRKKLKANGIKCDRKLTVDKVNSKYASLGCPNIIEKLTQLYTEGNGSNRINEILDREYRIKLSNNTIKKYIELGGTKLRTPSEANTIAQNRPEVKQKHRKNSRKNKNNRKLSEAHKNGYDPLAKDFVVKTLISNGIPENNIIKQWSFENIISSDKRSVDIYCNSDILVQPLAIECDGGSHRSSEDSEKEKILSENNIFLVRIGNIETKEDQDSAKNIICNALNILHR